jgi:basic membrane protein A
MHHALRNTYYVIFLLLVTACAASDCSSEDVFCAALVTDTQGIEDHGINQDTWAGLEEAKAGGIVDRIEFIEAVDARDYEKNIAYFAGQGFDVIVTVNPGLRDETLRAANLKPDSVFVGMNQPHDESRPNLIPVTFPEDQMGFFAGALAAQISETQVIGAVCETSGIDSMWRYCEGFRAGAISVNETIDVRLVYRDDGDREKLFLDEDWGYDTARGVIRRGADVIFTAGGVTGQGALRAAAEAGIKSIGTERDQRTALAGSGSGVVTSVLGDARFEVQEILRQIKEQKPHQSNPGRVRYIPLDQTFPENLSHEMDALLVSLRDGKVKTNVTLSKP